MNNQFTRTQLLFTDPIYKKITEKKIIIFGVGGVGGACVDALVRMGFKSITFVDYDTVNETNLNRQVFTNIANIGMYKCLALENHILEINKDIKIDYKIKKLTDNLEDFNLCDFDFVIDAIDSITSKLNLIEFCYNNSIPIVSSMGTGNRINASELAIMDIYETNYDPLAKVMRRELRKRNVKKLRVVSSTAPAYCKSIQEVNKAKPTPLSVSYVPPVSGYLMVSEVINTLMRG